MRSLAPALLLSLSLLLGEVAAGALKISGELRRARGADEASLARRASISGLIDRSDLTYLTNLTLGGSEYRCLIDTGSSDLWVAADVPNAKDTGKTASVNYAIGAANGPIKTAQLQFEGYTIENQAFIQATPDSSHAVNEGIIGLGPNSGSNVQQAFANSAGDAVLDRIFRQNISTPNYLTILLGRSDDVSNLFPGDLTVGEVVSPYQNITSQPKLAVSQVSSPFGQHWQTLLDTNGIIGPDGQPIKVTSKNAPEDRLNVVFDSGFSLPQVPKSVADAIYARVPNATFINTSAGALWSLPCDVELNITFKFAGVSFPIHPVDTNMDDLAITDTAGNKICAGAFQPITTAASPNFDMILGMAFLRNAYLLINFGDFVDGASDKVGNPYIQLLPLTDPAQAHADFVKVRMNGVDETNFQLLPALPDTEGDGDGDDNTAKKSLSEEVKPYLPYIIAGSVVVGVILLSSVAYCLRTSSRKKYRRLHEPAPGGLPTVREPQFASYQPSRRY